MLPILRGVRILHRYYIPYPSYSSGAEGVGNIITNQSFLPPGATPLHDPIDIFCNYRFYSF